MTFLPILQRELQVRARTTATYWTRFGVALLGVLICLPQLAGPSGYGTAAGVGRNVFEGIVVAAFVLSCVMSLVAADLVSAERRAGTLGLLFLTRVKAVDVLLRAVLLMLLLVPLPVLLASVTGVPHGPDVALLSPLNALIAAGDIQYTGARGHFWISLAMVLVTACLLLAEAVYGLVRSLQSVEVAPAPQTAMGTQPLPVLPPWRPRAELPPFEWLVLRQRGLKAAIWAAALISAVWMGIGSSLSSAIYRGFSFLFLQVPALLIPCITGGLFAWASSRFFLEARRTGELELLVTVPSGP